MPSFSPRARNQPGLEHQDLAAGDDPSHDHTTSPSRSGKERADLLAQSRAPLSPYIDLLSLLQLPPSIMTSSSRPSRSGPPINSSMYGLQLPRLRSILSRVHPEKDATLTSFSEVPSPKLSRLYALNMSDSSVLLLSFAPTLAMRLLRHEQAIQASEAALLSFLAAKIRNSSLDSNPSPLSSNKISFPSTAECLGSRTSSASLPIISILPEILAHSTNPRELSLPYTIFSCIPPGAPLSSLSIYLTLPERRTVDRQIGALVGSLSLITAPAESFGPVAKVLANSKPTTNQTKTLSEVASGGSKTWSEAFRSILEGVLRDAEDVSLLLPYDDIRQHFFRLAWRLDSVLTPRLVVIDAGEETNVLVERNADSHGEGSASRKPATMAGESGARVTGLRDWSQGIFGDPLFAKCFDAPSEAFKEGWKQGVGEEEASFDCGCEGTKERLLMYRCYHAILSIVTEHYRPQHDSSRRELEGRKKLTKALREMEKVDPSLLDEHKRGRSTSSSSAEASKRLKTEDDTDEVLMSIET